MIDRAHLEAERAKHSSYAVATTNKKRCQICLSIWPCEQSEILDLALDGIEMRARVNVDAPYSSMMQRTDEWQRAAIEDRKRAEGYRKALAVAQDYADAQRAWQSNQIQLWEYVTQRRDALLAAFPGVQGEQQ